MLSGKRNAGQEVVDGQRSFIQGVFTFHPTAPIRETWFEAAGIRIQCVYELIAPETMWMYLRFYGTKVRHVR